MLDLVSPPALQCQHQTDELVMTEKSYASNLAAAWSIDRQEKLLRQRVPGWSKIAHYRDELSAAKRKALDASGMEQRGDMLRATRRRDVIYVASLACLAVHEADLADFLFDVGERGGTVLVLDIDLGIPSGSITQAARDSVKAFRGTKRRAQTEPGREKGYKVAAERREAEARAKAEPFRERWGRRDEKTPDLLVAMDLSYNTAAKYLGKRPEAQRAFELAQEQAERNRKRRRRPA